MALVSRMRLARHLLPLALVQWRQKNVAGYVREHAREVDAPGSRQERAEQLRPADDHDLLGIAGHPKRGIGIVDDRDSLAMVVSITRDDDVEPARQRLADGVERLASHDDGLADREGL